jgi:hypothetical protein
LDLNNRLHSMRCGHNYEAFFRSQLENIGSLIWNESTSLERFELSCDVIFAKPCDLYGHTARFF